MPLQLTRLCGNSFKIQIKNSILLPYSVMITAQM